MSKIFQVLVVSLIAILISTPLIAGGHKYIAYPVIFVHGFNATESSWTITKNNLDYLFNGKYGYSSKLQYFPLMNYGVDKLGEFSKNGDCQVIAYSTKYISLKQVINTALENSPMKDLPPEEQKVIIVAHSFGGLVTRALLKQDATMQNKIAKVIFVGTPHYGSPLASALWIAKEVEFNLNPLIVKYARLSVMGCAQNPALKTNLPFDDVIYRQMKDAVTEFQNELKDLIYTADSSLPGLDIDAYGKAIEQCRLNATVLFEKQIVINGLQETISLSYQKNSTFLAINNLPAPQKYATIYSEVGSPSFSGNFMDLKFKLKEFNKYFHFPPGEDLKEIEDKGDVVVSSFSQRLQAAGLTNEYKIDKSHFGSFLWAGQTEQFTTIREALCEDAPVMKVEEPKAGNIYTTQAPIRGKLKDYLPLDNLVEVDLFNQGLNLHTVSNLKYDSATDYGIILNPAYEAGVDDYQAVIGKAIDLFPGNVKPYDTKFTLTLQPSNPANIKGAQQSMGFTYACLIDTTTPSDLDVEVSTKTAITVKFKEKIRKESFVTPDQDPQNYTIILKDEQGNPVSMTYAWQDNYTVKLTPQASLKENTKYTMTIKGDDPTTEDDLTTPFKIENLDGAQWYNSNPDPAENNLDRHGFDPDYKNPLRMKGFCVICLA